MDKRFLNKVIDQIVSETEIDYEKETRKLSMTVQLSDPETYEGGEFYVADKKFCPAKGSAIIFPSNFMFPHEAKTVTSGTRWSIITWLM